MGISTDCKGALMCFQKMIVWAWKFPFIKNILRIKYYFCRKYAKYHGHDIFRFIAIFSFCLIQEKSKHVSFLMVRSIFLVNLPGCCANLFSRSTIKKRSKFNGFGPQGKLPQFLDFCWFIQKLKFWCLTFKSNK